jgi:hypothetical protein
MSAARNLSNTSDFFNLSILQMLEAIHYFAVKEKDREIEDKRADIYNAHQREYVLLKTTVGTMQGRSLSWNDFQSLLKNDPATILNPALDFMKKNPNNNATTVTAASQVTKASTKTANPLVVENSPFSPNAANGEEDIVQEIVKSATKQYVDRIRNGQKVETDSKDTEQKAKLVEKEFKTLMQKYQSGFFNVTKEDEKKNPEEAFLKKLQAEECAKIFKR